MLTVIHRAFSLTCGLHILYLIRTRYLRLAISMYQSIHLNIREREERATL